MSAPLYYQTITEVGQALRSKSLSPIELTEALLARIDACDTTLRSYANVMAESALVQAKQAESEIVNGNYRGPLHGVPIAVKDLCCTTGVATKGGLAVLEDHVPTFDATVVARLEQAGAILLGKLNLTEGAMAGYNPKFPVPQNPWKRDHWSGASSSGSGAATAAGLAFGTLGSDTGGSIRHPAAVCGTVGLKPTWGLVSRHGVLDLAQSLDHVGPLTRSSVDAGIILQAMAGRDPLDPTTLADPIPDLLGRVGDPIAGLRIGWDERYASEDLASEFATAVAESVRIFENLGAKIIDVSMPKRLREYLDAWATLCSAEALSAHREFFPSRADEYGPWFRQWLELGAQCSAADYANAHHLRGQCIGDLRHTMREVDLLACPSTAWTAYPVNDEISYGPIPKTRDSWQSRYTVPMDYAGIPTLSLPCGLSSEQLPLSLQLVGHPLSEALLIQAGAAFEAETQWHTLHPPQWWEH